MRAAILEICLSTGAKKCCIVAYLKYDVMVIEMHYHTRQTIQ